MFATYGVAIANCMVDSTGMVKIFLGMQVVMVLMHMLSSRPLMVNFLQKQNPNPTMVVKMKENGKDIASVRFPFLSFWRAIVAIMTCVAIMQVDFPGLFPRHQLKAEDYGWSLMDVGVSATMFASGMTNRMVVADMDSKKGKSFIKELITSITSNLGICLGASVRFFMLTGIDYHDHVTEWGTHWNFFVTIAFLNFFGVFVRSSRFIMVIGWILLIGTELL